MTALTAVALSGLFTGCSKEMETNGETTAEADIIQTYENAFITRFGQPHENQTWGFGSVAGTRGVFANGNEWAANDRDDCKYKVPPALTEPQMNIVRIYFQNKQGQDYEDPQWTNYFIQQVYKGGVDATKIGPNSPEKYKAADGQTDIIGSDHMDHLAAINGDFVDHNNNFNHGDCSVYGNVLNYKGNLTTVEETYPVNSGNDKRHADKINLMTNSTTASFGYYNSNGSVRRTEYTGLVSWSTIKAWADANGHAGEADCLNDGWNRSFMGFDFEMMVGPDLYQKVNNEPRYVKITDIPGNAPLYIWDGINVIKWVDKVEYDSNWQPIYTFAEGYDEFIKIGGEMIPYLVANKNMYAGERLDASTTLTNITQSNLKVYKDYSNDVKNVECLNLPLIKAAFEAGYCPTEDKAQTWVKVGGTADGYYSDWIVTLTEAQKYDTPNPPDNPPYTPPTGFVCRIIAEDLTVGENSDFDFNDVVFDVFEDGKILVRACGGTLPLTVAGREVHGLFGQSTSTMINTGWTGTIDYVNTYQEINYGSSIPNVAAAYDIPVVVTKKVAGVEKPITLTAVRAKVASKIAVGSDYKWCAEREDIDSKYHKADGTKLFQQYVIGNLGDDWNAGTAWYQQK